MDLEPQAHVLDPAPRVLSGRSTSSNREIQTYTYVGSGGSETVSRGGLSGMMKRIFNYHESEETERHRQMDRGPVPRYSLGYAEETEHQYVVVMSPEESSVRKLLQQAPIDPSDSSRYRSERQILLRIFEAIAMEAINSRETDRTLLGILERSGLRLSSPRISFANVSSAFSVGREAFDSVTGAIFGAIVSRIE